MKNTLFNDMLKLSGLQKQAKNFIDSENYIWEHSVELTKDDSRLFLGKFVSPEGDTNEANMDNDEFMLYVDNEAMSSYIFSLDNLKSLRDSLSEIISEYDIEDEKEEKVEKKNKGKKGDKK